MSFDYALSKLKGSFIKISGYEIDGDFSSLVIEFSQGATLRSDYWRLIKNARNLLSNFDHNQTYGLSAQIDALAEVKKELEGKVVTEARLEKETGDLTFDFTDTLKLQVFNFTGYEAWEISFTDGSREYSNRTLETE